jgi:hypothetical protein
VISQPGWVVAFVGVLAAPQATHYVLDGFIWKMNGSNPDLRRLLNVDPRH